MSIEVLSIGSFPAATNAELAIDLLRKVFAFLPGGQVSGGRQPLKTQSAVTW